MGKQQISSEDITIIIIALIIGTLARLLVLKEDYRQYPSFPNGYLIQVVTGFVAAALGAVAIPALMTKNFVAVTFLTLALQQFRDVRKMEKESLTELENTEYTYRGSAYIDGIAKTFESRNYLAFITALCTSLVITVLPFNLWVNGAIGIVVGITVFYLLKYFTKGKSIGDIAQVKPGKIEVKDSSLYVDGMYVSNLLGTENAAKLVKEEGLAVVIYPNEQHYRINLDNFGQRQAALFEATRALGNKRWNFTRKDYEEGRIIIALVPIKQDIDALIEVVKKCPLLESTKKADEILKPKLKGEK
ncbi:YIEGIA family protein [Aquibacillus sp. 3ASR75-11]|uniref:YIEGIA family protein n=1 Tax=Terrihalobacillus insolitus TaxID=2950438 RepID=A0A9X3WU64_9BACI|nr:YIEGIA family protein [Terrihalobacillus insolitus]MDC3414805.1 YIEGIA family protein [Terrihalobacillus insolitus]MDC3425640.1 YIEGIA family protein [Terrihalobacillus insolitus]